MQNFREGWRPHTWSLGVEEQFYIGFTLLAWWTVRRRLGSADPFGWFPKWSLLVGLLLLGLRLAWGWDGGLMRVDALLCGVLLAYAYQFHREILEGWVKRRRLLLVGIMVAGLVLPFTVDKKQWTRVEEAVGHPGIYLGFGAMLLLCVCMKPLSAGWGAVICRPFSLIGVWSYSIYLWHWDVMLLAYRFFGKESHWLLQYTFYFLGSICLGVFMAQLVECPALKLRDRLFPSRTSNAVSTILRNPSSGPVRPRD